MKCDFCSKEAVMTLAQFENGEMKIYHLCADCYAERVESMAQELQSQMSNLSVDQIKQLMEDSMRSLSENFEKAGIDIEETLKSVNHGENVMGETPDMDKHQDLSASPEERALNYQKKTLKSRRGKLLFELLMEMEAEHYEKCAEIRNQLLDISNKLVDLTEKREVTSGV